METTGQTVGAIGGVLRILWDVIRLPLLGVLTLLEGIAQTVLGGVAFFSLLTALFFEYATPVAHFPFWTMLAISGGCVLTLILYFLCIRVLSD